MKVPSQPWGDVKFSELLGESLVFFCPSCPHCSWFPGPMGALRPSLGCRIFVKPVTSDSKVQPSQAVFLEGPDISIGGCGGPVAHGPPKTSPQGSAGSILLLHKFPPLPLPEVGQRYPPGAPWEHSGSLGNSPPGEERLTPIRLLDLGSSSWVRGNQSGRK